jgi:hypothetical protein
MPVRLGTPLSSGAALEAGRYDGTLRNYYFQGMRRIWGAGSLAPQSGRSGTNS